MLKWQLGFVFGVLLSSSNIRAHEPHPGSCSESKVVALQDHTTLLQTTVRNFQRHHHEVSALKQHPQSRNGAHKSADHRPVFGFDSLDLIQQLQGALASAAKGKMNHASSGTRPSFFFIGFLLIMVLAGLAQCVPTAQSQEVSAPTAALVSQHPDNQEGKGLESTVPRARSLLKAAKVGSTSFRIPMSCYGSAMILPILLEEDTWTEWWQTDGKCYFRLCLNYVIQIPLVYGLKLISDSSQELIKVGDCERTSLLLISAGLFLFVCFVLKDVEESIDMTDITWRLIPTSERSRCLMYVEDDDGLEFSDGGLSFRHKSAITIFILLPKYLIAFATLAYGSLFLAASNSNQDIILNVLALGFILEVDEMIFMFFAPRRLQAAMEAIPEFEDKSEGSLTRWLRRWGLQFKMIFCMMFVSLFYFLSASCGKDGWMVDVEDNPRGFRVMSFLKH